MSSKFPFKLYFWKYQSGEAIPSGANQNCDACLWIILRDKSQTVGNSPLRSSNPKFNPPNPTQTLRDQQMKDTVGSEIIRAFAIILAILSSLNANFYHLMLIINSINPKDHDLTTIFFIKMH